MRRPTSRFLLWLTTALAVVAAACGSLTGSTTETNARTPAEARQDELLRSNLKRPGDPMLGAQYAEINVKHFGGALPLIPVLWEPRLAEVGLLGGQTFTLEGMFGHVGRQSVILLDPHLQNDSAAFRRALCHEMAHVYLYVNGDRTTNHGPAFKDVLARLSEEGAFEGIAASDTERTQLRAWLDAESARLDRERAELDRLSADTGREKAEIERAMEDLNARVAAANAQGRALQADDDVVALTARRDAYNARAIEANERFARGQADLATFNKEVARYNLMLVYPDGMDDESAIAPKKTR